MDNSQNGSFQLVNSNVCPSCGSVTVSKEYSNVKASVVYGVLGWLFFAVSLVFVPILFGALSFCMGLITFSGRSKTHGTILMFFAAVGLIIGSLISIMVAGTIFI